MKTALFLVVVALVLLLVIAAIAKKKKRAEVEQPEKKRLLTQREEAMYNRLRMALPEKEILAQVAFGALVTARTRQVRNTFDRKIADFVVCEKSMQVIAIVELDDASHKSKAEQDKARDALLEGCGYQVVRYKNIPDIDEVQRDFTRMTQPRNDHANNDESAGARAINTTGPVLARKAKSE